ncbi:alpha-ketoacid dehydrogenase subunit beta [Pseudoalteromonas peptidolytica]|uniref:Pyruvate dehydrogenase E1 component beta subunit n=1 Tax=Pseudoalteromonas peptidolytica F12-50-A1 TaxID=1315280 RepID=A0A8I0MWZ6_9GAMM|nr:transketolase C-terminal domain-containing protein [Pseudoalteromonas peptidolytica]MBE0346887.1 pyruvate dehydrogenase E1 component beta subunit [Pseudoalteromonas peptidolytica F12-50-A1]NLR13789.1 alpha-ketoacid dehydrogenase subunit beta [Pseudoalteromonas peptidolytica]GEK09519.1 pyruvate dehydrogenase subunit beta [Pseudoalteromonas peptidolytica]
MSTPNSTRLLKYYEALNEGAAQAMSEDHRVFMMGLDVDDHKGIQGSTLGLVEKFGAERVFTTPLSEDAMTGVAIGAAMAGQRPIHVHIRMDFMMLCMNQLVNIAAKSHYMYGGTVQVPLVVRTMIGKSWGQGAQHSQGLHAMFAHVPGLKVVAPSNAHDAKGLTIQAVRDNNPVIIMEHRLLYSTESYVPEKPYVVEFGQSRVVEEGSDITIVAISNMVVEAIRAAELLSAQGISVEIIDPVTISPLDSATIEKSVDKTGKLLIVDNGWLNCGISAEISARVAESEIITRRVQVKRLGFAATTCPTTPTLENAFYPSPKSIAMAAMNLCNPQSSWEPNDAQCELAYQKQFKGPF